MNRNANHLLFVDWLRAIAITLVVVRHLLDRIWLPTADLDHPLSFFFVSLAGFGWSGVHLFFVVSGYLVGGHVIRTIQNGSFNLIDFTAARALRILPAAYTVVVIVGVLFFNDQYLIPGIIKNFAFVQTYTSGGFMPHFWSLCVEMHFYFALPFIAYAFRKRSLSTRLVVVAIIGFALLRAILPFFINGYLMKPTETHWLPDFFAVGILLAVRPISVPFARPSVAIAVYAGFALTLAAISGDPVSNVTKTGWGFGLLLTLVSSIVIFAAVKQFDVGRLGAVNRPVSYVARLSYAIYLVHLPIIEHSGGSTAVSLAGTIVATLALHYAIERPGLAMKAWLRTNGPKPVKQPTTT